MIPDPGAASPNCEGGGAVDAGSGPAGSALGGASGLGNPKAPVGGGGKIVGAPVVGDVPGALRPVAGDVPGGLRPVASCAAAGVVRSTAATATSISVSPRCG